MVCRESRLAHSVQQRSDTDADVQKERLGLIELAENYSDLMEEVEQLCVTAGWPWQGN